MQNWFNTLKSIDIIHNFDRIKEKKHIVISTNSGGKKDVIQQCV
jgi:hypothetical protein